MLLFLFYTSRAMERHRTVQNHYEFKTFLVHNILIDELVFHDIVEDWAIWYNTTGHDGVNNQELMIVIIEVEGVVTISDLKTENNKRI